MEHTAAFFARILQGSRSAALKANCACAFAFLPARDYYERLPCFGYDVLCVCARDFRLRFAEMQLMKE